MKLLSRIVFFHILFFGSFFSGQIYEVYPLGQDDYEGGNKQFYKDFHQVILDRNLKSCDNPNENYTIKLLVSPDKTIKYVKDDDSLTIQKNKCAFELSRNAVKYMKGWKPAVIDGKEVSAVASFFVIPKDLFENYKQDYDPIANSTASEYKGGITQFRKDVVKNIDLSRFNFTRVVKVEIRFVVGVDGKIDNIRFEQSSGLKEFDEMLAESIKKTKKWIPAMISGVPVRSMFNLPLKFEID